MHPQVFLLGIHSRVARPRGARQQRKRPVSAVPPQRFRVSPDSCHACGKSGGKLLCCGRCRGVWFCNRECQAVARKDLGHRGANCRPADGVQTPTSSATARSPFAVPSRPSTLMDMANLEARCDELFDEVDQVRMANTRVGYLAAVAKAKEAAAVADLIGGAGGGASFTGRHTSFRLPAQIGRNGRCRFCRVLFAADCACVGQHISPRQRPVHVRRRGEEGAERDGQGRKREPRADEAQWQYAIVWRPRPLARGISACRPLRPLSPDSA